MPKFTDEFFDLDKESDGFVDKDPKIPEEVVDKDPEKPDLLE